MTARPSSPVRATGSGASGWSSGRLRRVLRGHRGEILDVAVDPDGVVAATVSTDLARVGRGTCRREPSPRCSSDTNFVDAVDFGSPDGRSIATASLDGTARTWAINGRPLAVLAGHSGPCSTPASRPTARRWQAGERASSRSGTPGRAASFSTLGRAAHPIVPEARRRARTATLRRPDRRPADRLERADGSTSGSPATGGWSRQPRGYLARRRRLVSASRDRGRDPLGRSPRARRFACSAVTSGRSRTRASARTTAGS